MEVVYELNLQNWNGERFRTLFSHEKWRIVARATSRLHVRSIEPLDLEISVIRARETSRFPLEENEEEVKKRKKNSIFDLHEIFLSEGFIVSNTWLHVFRFSFSIHRQWQWLSFRSFLDRIPLFLLHLAPEEELARPRVRRARGVERARWPKVAHIHGGICTSTFVEYEWPAPTD